MYRHMMVQVNNIGLLDYKTVFVLMKSLQIVAQLTCNAGHRPSLPQIRFWIYCFNLKNNSQI